MWATAALFCYADGSDSGSSSCQSNGIYSNTSGQAASRTASSAIGMGMANTNAIFDRMTTAGGAATNTYAAGIAFDYTNNGKTDWHLPSKDELNQMCKWQRGVAWQSNSYRCPAFVGTLNSGLGASGFSSRNYWSSSDALARYAWLQSFDYGSQNGETKNVTTYVRSVRAFG